MKRAKSQNSLSTEFIVLLAQVVTQDPPNHCAHSELLHLSCFPSPSKSIPLPLPWTPTLNPLTLSDNALHTDHTAEKAGSQSPWRDMLRAKAALQSNVELLILFGIGSINGGHKIL